MPNQQSVQESPVQSTGCCPPFDPTPWHDQEVTWRDKTFLKDHVTCLFHVPLNMGRRIVKDMALIEAAQATSDRPLMLSELYFGYTTCPRCAKAYGKNYVVMFAKVGEVARSVA